jgi:hypothetical protein
MEDSLQELFSWLQKKHLTRQGSQYALPSSDEILSPDSNSILALPCSRTERKARAELDELRKDLGQDFSNGLGNKPSDWQAIWAETQNPKGAIRNLDIKRIPADAIAFYRPFHFPPVQEWGIYIYLKKLLEYGRVLEQSLGSLRSFTRETLAVAILFDVFHHEFFHHLVESTATVLEVVCAGLGTPRPLYLEYRDHSYETAQGEHLHKPLEEALANAYAYNSFSFISRVKVGYKQQYVRLYQKALEKCWPREPPGYNSAGQYIQGNQIEGARDLLSMFLQTDRERNRLPLTTLAQFVFPSGHMAFRTKSDIPTYLMGTVEELNKFYELVPAPNESYTNLFWPGDTKALDEFIAKKKKEEQELKKKQRQLRRGLP